MATVIRRCHSPYWYLKFMVKGKAYLQSSRTTNKDKALKLLRDTVEDLRLRCRRQELTEDVFQRLTEQTRTKLPIADAWKSWGTSPRKRNPSAITTKQYHSHWNQFVVWLGKSHPKAEFLHDVTPIVAEKYMSHLQSENVSPNTFNKNRNFLRAMFDALSVQAGITKNPWTDIPLKSLDTESRRAFTPEELQCVCSQAQGFLRYAIAIGLYTGLRLGDVCTLRWDEVDWNTKTIRRLARKTSRLKKELIIPIHPVLEAVLQEIPHDARSPYLFPREAETYKRNASQISNMVQSFLVACGIETREEASGQRKKAIVRVGFHSLRHSFVSLCAANNNSFGYLLGDTGNLVLQDFRYIGHGMSFLRLDG